MSTLLIEESTVVSNIAANGLEDVVFPKPDPNVIKMDFTSVADVETELDNCTQALSTIESDMANLYSILSDGSWLGEFADDALPKYEALKNAVDEIKPLVNKIMNYVSDRKEAFAAIEGNH